MDLLAIGIPVLIAIVAIFIFGFIIARLYKRTTPERAMIRTGAGGKKVIQNGGALIIPMMHELTWVNMRTLGLEIIRSGAEALITADRMRVDVGTKFYVRVKPDEEGISQAAKTLGSTTGDPEVLRRLIEDKLVDALRSVGAQMTMDELHEKRAEFVQKVQAAVDSDLVQNGLELESVSLTMLDQTPFDKMDTNNAFNAVGMQARARIASEARVKVAETEQTAILRELEIKKGTEEARIAQEQAVSTATADSKAKIAIAQSEATQNQEAARIAQEQALAIAEQTRQIAINQKSMEESQAKAAADLARAEAVSAEQAVKTASEVAVADRAKKIAIIQAEQTAEQSATGTRVAAATQRAAAEDTAAAILTRAQADADAVLIQATAQANANKVEAEGLLAKSLAEAEGKTAMVEAENSLTADIIEMKLQLARLEALPAIIAEMVAPAQNIDRITLHHVTGLGGSNSGEGSAAVGNGGGGAAGSVADAIMGMALTLPVLKSLGDQAGVNISEGLSGVLDGAMTSKDVSGEARAADTAEVNRIAELAGVRPVQQPKPVPVQPKK
jgi:flotillin